MQHERKHLAIYTFFGYATTNIYLCIGDATRIENVKIVTLPHPAKGLSFAIFLPQEIKKKKIEILYNTAYLL